ncbi:hypothetical protein [Acinetobacter sp. MD2(2019)]|uniref:hypothetical protein n=1 Tax=Acinetobacter sp. MD2(2019) TaxID=2605273 RepID=UPI002D1E8399|nr:hypothetical protein [Acinetobacter sp. MD2(2019)]MEB3754917.1 hypothetical protein [Acinetobacter sp. MD2(2019)]
MKNLSILLGIGGLCLVLFAIFKIQQPSQNEIERYQAILCFIIRQPDATDDHAHLMQDMEKYQQGSISDYAVQHPDFRPKLADSWVKRYLSLNNQQKQRAKENYLPCVEVLKQTTAD